jgi:tetratricopeptide (TPR) repeat protein
MKKTVLFLAAILVLCCGIASSIGRQAVSEEARRYLARGEAALEMAKSPDEYDLAAKEFQEAARLAPTWPVPFYNLGLVYEKAGKLKEAIASLGEYLRLAPEASDAAEVKERIYKLEYKVEREDILTIADIVDVLVSFGKHENWQIVKRGIYERNKDFATCEECGYLYLYAFITRVDNDKIRVPRMLVSADGGYRIAEEESYNIIKIEGSVVKFDMQTSYVGYPIRYPYRAETERTEIEVVSRTCVKTRSTVDPGIGAQYVAEYRKQ